MTLKTRARQTYFGGVFERAAKRGVGNAAHALRLVAVALKRLVNVVQQQLQESGDNKQRTQV